MSKSIYKLYRMREWGEAYWMLAADGSSPFGRYDTKAEAMADARRYNLTVVRA
jgi:hypothetical protein